MSLRLTDWRPMALASLAAMMSASAWAEGLEPALEAIKEAKPLIDLRLRSESVDQSGIAKEADALTLRGRFGFETGKLWQTTLLAEAQLTTPLEEHYNSGINHKTQYPTVVDPENYALNRLQLMNTALPDTTLILGRQRITLDDQRFVGNSGWRQNEQTFDSFRIVNKSIAKLTFDLTYLNQVNRVYGKDSPVGTYTGDTYLLNAGYDTPFGKLSAFEYLLAFDQAHTDSSQTRGVRFAGDHPIGAVKLAYVASWATQHEYAHNPLLYSVNYYIAEATGSYRQFSLGGGIETLEGNGVKGFSTPLATFHKFDGWDDKFLTTPANGLQRRYVSLGYLAKAVGFLDILSGTAVYHDFRSSRLDVHYGSEIDLMLQGKWHRFTGLVKFADYAADRFATSTRKLWLEIDYLW